MCLVRLRALQGRAPPILAPVALARGLDEIITELDRRSEFTESDQLYFTWIYDKGRDDGAEVLEIAVFEAP